MNLINRIVFALIAILAICNGAMAQSWRPLANRAPFGAGVPLLLTDGAVLVQQSGTSSWWKLKPDATGSYANGTWTQVASLPAGYAPLYFASAVLADGRVVVFGGEYINFASTWSNRGAIYDPSTNAWTELPPPSGWQNIGDAQCLVLPDGKFMLANPFDMRMAVLDPTTLTWTARLGTGKLDRFDEEGWTLMPDGSVLSLDATNSPSSERYLPATDSWIWAGTLPQSLVDPGSQEMGPVILRPDGTAFAAGATGHNAMYFPGATMTAVGTWVAMPDFPLVNGVPLTIADGPACLLPSGNVLCGASPGVFQVGTHFFEFDGTSLIPEPATPNSGGNSSYQGNMLMLPTGQVLYTDFSSDVQIYTPLGSPKAAWKPTISTVPANVTTGQSFAIAGNQFNGLSQCSFYGDDSTNATNYPLVRITNSLTGHVFYCRTHDHSTMGVATGVKPTSTTFDVPTTTEFGASQLEVVVNGIASAPVSIIVGTGTSAPVITSISPSSVPANSAAFTLAVGGIQFVNGDTVLWMAGNLSSTLSTTYGSALELSATVPANLVASVGTASVSVQHPDGRRSNAVPFTVTNPVPVLGALSPSSVRFGSPSFTLSLTGGFFMNAATVQWNTGGGNKTLLASTWISATQITAVVPASLVAATGKANIDVTNPGPGGGTASLPFSISGAVSIKSSNPTQIAALTASTLTVNGAGFQAGAQVLIGSVMLPTVLTSAAQLSVAIPSDAIASAGTVSLQVVNPDGGVSNALSIRVVNGKPTVTSVSPSSITAGGPTFTLTVAGTRFMSASVVKFGGKAVVTTFVSSGLLHAVIPSASFATKGSYTVSVTNPTPGGGNSSSLTVMAR